jgi:hypothetical protein
MIDDVIFRDYLKGLDPATGLPVKDGRSSSILPVEVKVGPALPRR